MGWIIVLITCALCGGLIFGGYFWLRKQVVGSAADERDRYINKINTVIDGLDGLAGYADSYISNAQFQDLLSQIEEVRTTLENEKQALGKIESGLDTAQKSVEEKESVQQEIKSSREEDEGLLEELLAGYTTVSDESTVLEHKLAESLKNLDRIMEEVTLTEAQKDLLTDLSNALEKAGATLRGLLMEYESVNGRLNNLNAQHTDLEDEYTKLVEQQLGE